MTTEIGLMGNKTSKNEDITMSTIKNLYNKHFQHCHLMTIIQPPSHRITISKPRELLSVANQDAAHPLLFD